MGRDFPSSPAVGSRRQNEPHKYPNQRLTNALCHNYPGLCGLGGQREQRFQNSIRRCCGTLGSSPYRAPGHGLEWALGRSLLFQAPPSPGQSGKGKDDGSCHCARSSYMKLVRSTTSACDTTPNSGSNAKDEHTRLPSVLYLRHVCNSAASNTASRDFASSPDQSCHQSAQKLLLAGGKCAGMAPPQWPE